MWIVKVNVMVLFKNGLEKQYEIKLDLDQTKESFINDNTDVFRQKWRDNIQGGSLSFVTTYEKTVVVSMDEVLSIEFD
jgi:hypothetical protein